ncbi:MAG: FAD-binding protein [Lachnospiraceae bacterium]|jgi:succinate dehydrogenase/fumarate reductase flavoprotein subunit|nr:FAD-binding protein [Lachnospiraceae bacterium]
MEQLVTKLCIIGGSGGGMAAALRARECGVDDIIILERNKMLGGTFRYVSGIFGVGTELQEKAGADIDIDYYYSKMMDHSNWSCDARLVRKWYGACRKILKWTQDSLGLEYYNLTAFSGTSLLFHQGGDRRFPTGTTLARLMEAKLRSDPSVRVFTETRAHRLLASPDGRVCGVLATGPDGAGYTIDAGCVILATGSVSGNEALVKRFYHRDDYDQLKVMSKLPHNQGDGLTMAEAIGASTGAVSCLYIGPHNHPHNMRTGLVIRRSQVMKINCYGERFVNEALPNMEDLGWFECVSVDRQPGKTVYGLMDQGLLDRMMRERTNQTAVEAFQGNFTSDDSTGDFDKENVVELKSGASPAAWIDSLPEDLHKEAEAGRVFIGDTLDEVAGWVGCDRGTLQKSVDDYNRFCSQGYDEDFLKDPMYLQPFTKGPYYCLRSYSGVDTFIGGLMINHSQQVIRKSDWKPIPGLYAAGVLTSGWLGDNYGYYGSESSYTLYSGYACGENAAGFLGPA